MRAKHCEHCGAPLMTDEIRWRIKFLAEVAGNLNKIEPIGEDAACGLMWFLYDIAEMLNPEGGDKEGAK